MATAAYHTQPARPTTAAVLAYLAAGHSNAEAADHFGIHERSVRRIKQRAGERANSHTLYPDRRADRISDPRIRIGEQSDRVSDQEPDLKIAPAPPTFPPTADDVAGDHTMWKCPATGELMPIVPGTRRKDWERERRETHARHVAAIMSRSAVRTPDTTPATGGPDRSEQQPFTAWQSEKTGPDSGALGAYVAGPVRTAAPRNSDEFDPQGDDVPLWSPDAAPGHARPDLDEPGAESPELPPEAFPNPEPNQPAGVPRSPSGGEQPEERPRRPEAIIVRQIVRVPEPRQMGGLVGWLSTNPMLGPVPVWALLLLAFGALLVQLGLLG